MRKPSSILISIVLTFFMLLCISVMVYLKPGIQLHNTIIDIKRARKDIENLDKQFSKYFFDGDSLALANMYTKDAQFGTSKGAEIPSALGNWVRNSIKNDSRIVIFSTTSLTSDAGFLIELGNVEIRDSQNNSKHKGKYLVVWKKENGTWKLYRDIVL